MADHVFIIGAQRCGTSYLYTLLDEHPDIDMAKPVRPEPKFFMRDDTVGSSMIDYERQYFAHSKAAVWGEKSTSYIESPDAARRIRDRLPGAKILAVLREPAARAVSNYHFSVDHGVEPLGLWDALNRTPAEVDAYDRDRFSVSPWGYVRRGRYASYLEAWRGFDLHLELFENLVGDPLTITRIYTFLGVERFDPPSLGKVINASTHDAELTAEQWASLRARFADSNAVLERDYGLDLGPWAA